MQTHSKDKNMHSSISRWNVCQCVLVPPSGAEALSHCLWRVSLSYIVLWLTQIWTVGAMLLDVNSPSWCLWTHPCPKLLKPTACLTIFGHEVDCLKVIWVPYSVLAFSLSPSKTNTHTHTHTHTQGTTSTFPCWRGSVKRMSQIRSQMSLYLISHIL